jgi:hypothetical protein
MNQRVSTLFLQLLVRFRLLSMRFLLWFLLRFLLRFL